MSLRIGRTSSYRVLAPLGAIAALVIAFGIHPATLGRETVARSRPNVIVIESDDQTLESMRVMDDVNSLIGGEGATFDNNFVNFSLCCPSRATFLTGQYAHNHRVLDNQAPNGGFARFESLHGDNNLAVWLHRAGYYTGVIGKYLTGYASHPSVPPGWSEWHTATPDARTLDPQGVYNYTLNENGTAVHYGHGPAHRRSGAEPEPAVQLSRCCEAGTA